MFHVETYRAFRAFSIVDETEHIVDVVRTERVASSHTRLLNDGRAHINRHAPLGCRVVLTRTTSWVV